MTTIAPGRDRRARRIWWRRGRRSRPTFWLLAILWCAGGLRAAETIPPAPRDHFNDYAGIVDRAAAQRLNAELAQFERDTSNQIVVAIFPRMQSDSSVEDYTVRVAQAWGVGTKGHDNGAVLFAFQESHDLRIVTGYGLEGALPDALCKRIIEDEIVPRFRSGDFAGGMAAGVHAMMAAARGEYQGSGRTVQDARRGDRNGGGVAGRIGMLVVFVLIIVSSVFRQRRGMLYHSRGRRGFWVGPGGWGGGGGGGGWSGGGGGSFSGGGGSFGGGGAGGKW